MNDKLKEFAKTVMKDAERETEGWQMTINGQFATSLSGKRYTTVNPSTDKPLAEVPFAGAEDVALAVDTAKAAFPAWRKLHVDERGKMLKALSRAVRERAEVFGMLDALDCGNPYQAMVDDANKGAGLLEHFANLGMELKGQTISTPGGGLNYTRLEPFGVVARILPFNHPVSFAVGKIASALIAGNTVVLKIADQTPLSALLFGKLIQQHLPPGVVNVITGDGATTGASLVTHPEVRRIAFTGSVATGERITQQAGIAVLSLELGGKNPLIIYPDVDVSKVADAAVAGMNFTRCQGQSCGSNSRVFVHRDLHDEFVREVVERVRKIRIGHADADGTEMGPVVTREHYNRVMKYIESGKSEGAKLVTGGGHAEGAELAAGYFIEPTVFDQVTHRMTIAQEEIFGPVMSILEWEDEQAMMAEVNGVEYGLCANVWTNDISTALRIADEIEAGYVWINGHGGKRFKGAPFGGYKSSGIGREHSTDEILSFTQVKNINVRY
ncbi:aldehyde dehydrogenase family protein [Marinobacter sp. BSs20148]|uniref:aldehyde dehydrogenase family protein n=1 Tax=Marinobacter sp. BSs20148 TaxID=490759 RepID=UPI000277680F|nr:aldehyde dehydrogenase family protein [Marinobacter sp. BSs20148]AFP30216.1 Aldehyde dehydrogenase [Marinobacter sp. BSs20148]